MLAVAMRESDAYESDMLAMADRLFSEFDALPVQRVFRALGAARAQLRERGASMPSPAQVEDLARRELCA